MSRDRRAADPWTTRSPESPDFADPEAKWSSLTDTGSLQPSDEALDWQRRADAWAQQAESDPSQSVEPANRWSDVAATGRPTFPADGVGWRTETAEWRATGARWRQTTEWRSTTGSHVWRSTTEAWQTGGNSAHPSDAETPMAQPAISSSAWSADDDQEADTRPSWQQFADPATPSRHSESTPGWEQPSTTTPSWQQPDSSTPSWQQPAQRPPAESSPSWQNLVDQPPQQPSWNARPSWQRDAIEGSATWTDLTDNRTPPSGAPADSGASWLRTEEPRDDGRHLVREDDRAAWRRGVGDGPAPIGRRRAPETGTPSGGTGWSATRPDGENQDSDNWAGHDDTGGLQLFGDSAQPNSWGTGTGFGSRNVGRREEPTGRRAAPSDPYEGGYQVPPAAPYVPPRTSRRDDTSAARALPPGRYDEAARPRYAEEEPAPGRYSAGQYAPEQPGPGRYGDLAPESYPAEQPGTGRYGDPAPGRSTAEQPGTGRYGDPAPGRYGADQAEPGRYAAEQPGFGRSAGEAPTGRRRGHRYADETGAPEADPGYPRRSAAAPASGLTGGPTGYPPETRAGRRSRAAAGDETATFGSVPAGYDQEAPPARGSAPKGRPKYAEGKADWREQTGSWEAEPDTSSWVRDPDTGQWSRSEDDPRILAWRREAARREAMGEGPRALPAPGRADAAPEPGGGGWRNGAQPQLPPAPTPRSATPYGGPADDRYDGPGGPIPRSDMPYGAAPASAPPYGATNAFPSSPGFPAPSGARGEPGYREPTGIRGEAGYPEPTGIRGEAGYPEPTGTRGEPGYTGRRGAPDHPGNGARGDASYSGARSDAGYPGTRAERGYPELTGPRDEPVYPEGGGRRGAAGYPGTNGARAGSGYPGPPAARGYPELTGPQGEPGYADRAGRRAAPGYPDANGSRPERGYDEPTGLAGEPGYPGSAGPGYPGAATPGSAPGYPGAATPRSAPGYSSEPDYFEPTNPRSAAGYSGSAPASGTGYLGEAPASGRGYSGAAPASGTGYSAAAPASGTGYAGAAPASGTGYSAAPASGTGYRSGPGSSPANDYPSATPTSSYGTAAPARSLPPAPRSAPDHPGSAPAGGAPRYSGAAPAGGVPQSGSDEQPYRSGRRRAEDDEPTTRRGLLDPTAYPEKPLGPETWSAEPAPRPAGRPAPDAPPWSGGESTQSRPSTESGTWHLAERQERARGSAVYRDGGDADWRRDLADPADLAEGESRRFGTSDYVPFRAGGSAAVASKTNLSTTSTSLISLVPPEQRDALAYPPRPGGAQGLTGSYERRPVTGGYPTVRRSDLLDPDDEEDEQESGGPLAAVGYTVGWYGVPVVLFGFYMLVLNSGAKTHALDTLGEAAPQFGISLVLSVVVAIGLRWVSTAWKAISVGLAAAVVGGGLATVLTSAITGNSLS